METGIFTKTLSCVLVSTCTSNCCTFMLMRFTTASMNGVFQFSPGNATRANFPNRCTMATCAVSTVKNEPNTTLKPTTTINTPKNQNIASISRPPGSSQKQLLFRAFAYKDLLEDPEVAESVHETEPSKPSYSSAVSRTHRRDKRSPAETKRQFFTSKLRAKMSPSAGMRGRDRDILASPHFLKLGAHH